MKEGVGENKKRSDSVTQEETFWDTEMCKKKIEVIIQKGDQKINSMK